MRADKALWFLRIFKTRSLATEACKKGKVKRYGETIKASSTLIQGDELEIKLTYYTRKVKVLEFPSSRISNKLLPEYLVDLTSDAEKEKEKLSTLQARNRSLYKDGKPSKKDRRDISDFLNRGD